MQGAGDEVASSTYLQETYLPLLYCFLAAQLALPPGMTLQAISFALHDGLLVCGQFSIDEMSECSNVREILANLYTLKALVSFVSNP